MDYVRHVSGNFVCANTRSDLVARYISTILHIEHVSPQVRFPHVYPVNLGYVSPPVVLFLRIYIYHFLHWSLP